MANLITWKDTVTFNVGDTISVHQKIVEGDKTRTQIFKGIVISIKGHQGLKSFVVRKIATASIAVEKIFPLETPTITKIELIKKGKVRRAKLYYLRDRVGKKATKVKDVFVKKSDQPKVEEVKEEVVEKKEAPKEELIVKKEEKKKKTKKSEARERRKKKKPKKIVRKEKHFNR